MPTAEQAYQNIIKHIEENRLEDAVSGLLEFAGEHGPDKMTAVRMGRSDWKTLEEEALLLGNTSSIRERRGTLKLELFRLADAILKNAAEKPAASPAESGSHIPVAAPFSTPRGEGPVKVFLAYAPGEADRTGGAELQKSMALLLHLKRVEIFDQQKSPVGAREATLAKAMAEAEVILLLLSNNFLSDLECLNLQENAFSLYQQNRAAVVPILFNPCEWKELDIGRLQALPRNGRFVSQWANADEAFTMISREISELAKNIRSRLDYGEPTAKQNPKAQARQQKRAYDTAMLRDLFRKGNTGALIKQLIHITSDDGPVYDEVLLLEQRWKAVSEDEKNNTASQESLTIRKNQLNQGLLQLIREMEGA